MKRREVLTTRFDFISYEDVFETIERWRRVGQRDYVTFTPPYSVMLSIHDSQLAGANTRAGLVLPDGIGIILAAQILGYANSGRVSGPTLMLRLCDWGRKHGYRHYFYGGATGVPEALRERLSAKYPGLQVVGTYSPPFGRPSEEEDRAIVEAINAAKPDIVWVGLGSPKQEVWMRRHVGRIDACALIGVGAAFDFHSGVAKWAPALIRKLGLEWAYRLAHEPRRLWRRTAEAPRFLLRVICQRLRMRRFSSSPTTQSAEDVAGGEGDVPRGKTTLVRNGFTVDVEEWFHILDANRAPTQAEWPSLGTRVEGNMDRILELLNEHGVQATFFWLGWVARRQKALLRRCSDLGHEIACHGENHIQPLRVGPEVFRTDIADGKKVIEDIVGTQVYGFRAAGFGVEPDVPWVFDVIREVGYLYDSSIFLARCSRAYRWHSPHLIHTRAGPLIEVPVPAITLFGIRLFLFGGGYLRMAPRWLIKWAAEKAHSGRSGFVLYVHPREIDCDHPGLPLGPFRRFRHYGNTQSTMPKLKWLLDNNDFVPLYKLARGAKPEGHAMEYPSVAVERLCD